MIHINSTTVTATSFTSLSLQIKPIKQQNTEWKILDIFYDSLPRANYKQDLIFSTLRICAPMACTRRAFQRWTSRTCAGAMHADATKHLRKSSVNHFYDSNALLNELAYVLLPNNMYSLVLKLVGMLKCIVICHLHSKVDRCVDGTKIWHLILFLVMLLHIIVLRFVNMKSFISVLCFGVTCNRNYMYCLIFQLNTWIYQPSLKKIFFVI